jgi:deoxyribodipyrimidine photo-lyase
LQPGDRPDPATPTLVLVHDEDAMAEDWGLQALDIQAVAGLHSLAERSPLEVGARAQAFTDGALEDALSRAGTHFSVAARRIEAADLAETARSAGARQIITQRPHAGPLRDVISAQAGKLEAAGVKLIELRRDWDRAFHPHADKGFFKVKKKIPSVLGELGLS